MTPAYSEDFRIRTIQAVEEDGNSARSARPPVWDQPALGGRFRREGSVSARKTGLARRLKVETNKGFLVGLMKDRDTTLDDLQRAFLE